MPSKAVVLFSGGLDSSTVLAIARDEGFEAYALSFDYGQRHKIELEKAEKIASSLGAIQHKIVQADLRQFGGSALTDSLKVPKGREDEEIENGIPVTYVPARNTIFLSFALAYAEVIQAYDIFVGVNAVDYSGYPDCRPEFISAFENLANLATKAGTSEGQRFKIRAPLVKWTKSQIIKKGIELGVDYGKTHSCYAPSDSGLACGQCDSCFLRLKGFKEAGLKDPAIYAD